MMKKALSYSPFALALITLPAPALAGAASVPGQQYAAHYKAGELPAYIRSMDYARQTSGVDIYGDPMTWWSKAAYRYERGHTPRIGAVMAFKPHGNLRLGHVATVSRVIDKRHILIRHANWSPINGRRGQIERDVLAVDVSKHNDWSAVRVWYAPNNDLGATAWPVYGFIYNGGKPLSEPKIAEKAMPATQIARAPARRNPPATAPTSQQMPSNAFQTAFRDF
ncbi:CHAP domain-containing protein [Altericroceibacterium spongiae]|uniref:CHAP domain-containing protein n=1 Tax=Altericroceibacterium spongiae TaxID=2320269 RepID=A0A420EK60_9SPHN|nr:CHAP domain-containing protein [Altericroceibacterium spongiae]RKF21067.1 CHAP domain-containing protein [Altericroceibacterium spongiae]